MTFSIISQLYSLTPFFKTPSFINSTSMHDDMLESLAVLRMNSKWFLERRDIFQDVLKHLDTGVMDGLSVM